VTGQASKTRTPLATAFAKGDDGIRPVARRLIVDIRFYIDPDTGLPHIYGHGVTGDDGTRRSQERRDPTDRAG
jgi:hypothetical protein